MRLVMAALILIILSSFYNDSVAELFSLSLDSEGRVYRLVIFWAAAIGAYGAVLVVFGLVRAPQKRDEAIRILPQFLAISALIALFFYLVATSLNAPDRIEQRRLQPGETITI
jgi:nitrate/nitrite transporter NarK